MKSIFSRLTWLAGLFSLLTLSLHANPVLAGNPGLAGNSLDAAGAKAILLGKSIKIGSERVVLIVVKESATQDDFLKATVGMNSSQFQNHWRRLFMTGGGTAPKVVANDTEAIALTAATPGAVCVVDSAAAGSLTVLNDG